MRNVFIMDVQVDNSVNTFHFDNIDFTAGIYIVEYSVRCKKLIFR